jgi:hypothetical protein
MQPKPDFLGHETARAFQDADVAAAYQHRPPYPRRLRYPCDARRLPKRAVVLGNIFP